MNGPGYLSALLASVTYVAGDGKVHFYITLAAQQGASQKQELLVGFQTGLITALADVASHPTRET